MVSSTYLFCWYYSNKSDSKLFFAVLVLNNNNHSSEPLLFSCHLGCLGRHCRGPVQNMICISRIPSGSTRPFHKIALPSTVIPSKPNYGLQHSFCCCHLLTTHRTIYIKKVITLQLHFISNDQVTAHGIYLHNP